MSPVTSLDVKFSGPLFTPPGLAERVVRDAVRDTVQDLAERGERMVKAQLYPGHGFKFGNLRRSITSRVEDRLTARVDTDVVYGPWVESGASRRQTRFKGYAMFRKSRQAMERMKLRLLSQHVARAARRLNGGV